jgi:hypothetical protein
VYPGNLQGRHAKETGPKGASVITALGNVVQSVEHRALDVFRWELLTVDAGPATDAIEVVDIVRAALAAKAAEVDGRVLSARVVITGNTRANVAIRRDLDRFTSELRAAATEGLGETAWLEKVIVQTRAMVDLARIREESSAVGHLARRLASIKDDAKELAELGAVLAELDKKLPAELREGEGALRLGEPAILRAMLDDVEQMLVPRLLEGGEH